MPPQGIESASTANPSSDDFASDSTPSAPLTSISLVEEEKAVNTADDKETLDEMVMELIESDRIQEIVQEIEEDEQKLESLNNELNDLEAIGDGMMNFMKQTLAIIEKSQVEQDLAEKGKELKENIKDRYDEDSLNRLDLKLFKK